MAVTLTAFATAADMLRRFDVRLLGDLVGDAGVRVAPSDLLTHDNLLTALNDAAGEIMSALLMGQRYTEDQLNDLTGNSESYLNRMNCGLALCYLYERRPWSEDPRRQHAIDSAERIRKDLEALRSGKIVLDTDGAKNAGLPTGRTPPLSVVNPLNMTVDRAREGYYMNRQMPTG